MNNPMTYWRRMANVTVQHKWDTMVEGGCLIEEFLPPKCFGRNSAPVPLSQAAGQNNYSHAQDRSNVEAWNVSGR